ncbi:RluA family pseudouridine synthase [Shewanella sp. NIFS-20-20]|uniref:RluA family pseudouridine synthase n=1 Tax=Shewanella sp. NIFS-20-20 TaxID=2853806 RepID=UPI001C488309|nr:RluA family pseudouridine synthase [Shewanella sp. NIFS-20-20]MBV7317569.1 RluA family pseudouridine synthase [Shewanella sp. NIFS-20-20]
MPISRTPMPTNIDDFVAPVCHQDVTMLYQDDDILLIDKPSGLLSLSGKNPKNWDSVHHRLVHGQVVDGRLSTDGAKRIQAIDPMALTAAKLPHRLDFGTSGIMVVALTPAAAKHLNQQFQQRLVQKHYIAMLDGWVSAEHGQINAAIAKGEFPRMNHCELSGKPARSDYQVLARLTAPARSLVKYTPVTGRTHQLRLHSWLLGHPILGCDLYANQHSQQLAPRLQLHASDLYFTHPITGQAMHGHSPCPF